MAYKCAIDFHGIAVNVALHPTKKSTRGAGFKNIGPDGQPPVGKSFEATTGREITSAEIGKAVSIGRGKAAVLHPLTPEQHAAITDQAQTKVMEIDSFAPIDSIPFELALMSYTLTPDLDVAGADRNASVLWNGLRGSGLAYVTQATISSRDSMIAIWATDTALKAVSLPFVAEMYPAVSYDWTVNEDQANTVAQAIEQLYEVKPFDLNSYASQFEARRNDVIEQVLAGTTFEAPAPAEVKNDTPDLMDMLKGLTDKKAPRKPAASKTKATA